MFTFDEPDKKENQDSSQLPVVKDAESSLAVNTDSLNKESLELINKIIAETDVQKSKDLTHLFNLNQNKKAVVRVNKLNDLMDAITDQAVTRLTVRPDEISNAELMTGLKVVQDVIERSTKQVNGVADAPLIQINQQNNEVNVDTGGASGLGRESRERVKNAVLSLLNGLNNGALEAQEPDDIDLAESTQEESQDSNLEPLNEPETEPEEEEPSEEEQDEDDF